VDSDQSTFVPYRGEPFISRQRVEWRVGIPRRKGPGVGWSKLAHFELGLLSTNDWQANGSGRRMNRPLIPDAAGWLAPPVLVGQKS